jgi:enamine deaminase RidA (YjgF/YER057c/UK114 family)
MSPTSMERRVAGTIDAGGVYCSRAAAGGGYLFLTGNPVGGNGNLADAAQPPEPYRDSPSAQVHYQTQYVFEELGNVLPQLGSSLLDIAQLEQYVRLKIQSEGYFEVALSPKFMGPARPGGATAQVGEYFPAEAAITVTGIAVVPDEAAGFVKSFPGDKNPNSRFADVVAAGSYGFTTYFPADMGPNGGLHPSVQTENWIWRGSEIRKEADFAIETLKVKLEMTGASFADVVDYTLFLNDVGDLYEVDEVFAKALGPDAPSRTIIPIKGTALPRREGAFGHEEGAPRMEVQFRWLIPGRNAVKVVVNGPGSGVGFQSSGVRGGPLLWLSSQVADKAERSKGIKGELASIIKRLEETCRNGGTTLSRLLRLRALLTDPADVPAVFEAVRQITPSEPPTVCIAVVPPPFPIADCSVALDGVALVEE